MKLGDKMSPMSMHRNPINLLGQQNLENVANREGHKNYILQ